jgi:hypothetical protein
MQSRKEGEVRLLDSQARACSHTRASTNTVTTRAIAAPMASATHLRLMLKPSPFRRLGDVLDDLDELIHAVAVSAGERDELAGALDDGSLLGRPRDRDATTTPELE